jgi:hypothetical protein
MATPAAGDSLVAIVRVLQIIVGALIVGPLALLAASLFISPLIAPPAGAAGAGPSDVLGPILNYMAVAFGALAVCMCFVVPPVISAASRKTMVQSGRATKPGASALPGAKVQPIDEARASLLTAFQTQFIVGAAILEGAAIFAAVAYLLYGHPIALGVAIVIIGVSLARIPTRARTQLWIEQQQEKLRDEGFAPGFSR